VFDRILTAFEEVLLSRDPGFFRCRRPIDAALGVVEWKSHPWWRYWSVNVVCLRVINLNWWSRTPLRAPYCIPSILSLFIEYIMKTCEWTPKRRGRALGLIKGGRHSLLKISQITNIPTGTLGDLKKRDAALSKAHTGCSHKLSKCAKRAIERLIRQSYKTRCLLAKSIIYDLQVEVCESTVKLTLKDLGYRHCIVG